MKLLAVFLLLTASCVAAITFAPGYDATVYVQGDAAAGITFNPQGDLFTFAGCLYKYPAAALAASLPLTRSNTYLLSCPSDVPQSQVPSFGGLVSTGSGRLYLSSGFELSSTNGAATRRWYTTAQHGIALDSRDGSLLFSDYNNGKVYRVPNPDTNSGILTPVLFFDSATQLSTGIDGLAVGADGTVYMAGVADRKLVIVNSTGQLITTVSPPNTASYPDGISICGGDNDGFVLATTGGGDAVVRFNLTGPGGAPTYAAANVITETGGYNDWSAVDPTSGCIFFTDISNGLIRRLSINGGCPCFSAQAAAPGGDTCSQNTVVASSDCTRSSASASGSAVSLSIGTAVTGHCDFVNGVAV